MTDNAEERRTHVLTENDIQRIATAVIQARPDFHIGPEEHYNSHKRLDRLLDAYDSATSTFTKAFIGLVVVGALVLAGIGAYRGH